MERLEAELEWLETRWGPLVARCGAAAHLVPDILLVTDSLIDYHPARQQGHIPGLKLWDAADSLVEKPCCRHCRTARPHASADTAGLQSLSGCSLSAGLAALPRTGGWRQRGRDVRG